MAVVAVTDDSCGVNKLNQLRRANTHSTAALPNNWPTATTTTFRNLAGMCRWRRMWVGLQLEFNGDRDFTDGIDVDAELENLGVATEGGPKRAVPKRGPQ